MGNGLKTNIADSQFKMHLINNSATPLNEIVTNSKAELANVLGTGSGSSDTIMSRLSSIGSNITTLLSNTNTSNTANANGTLSQKLSYLMTQTNAINSAVANSNVNVNSYFANGQKSVVITEAITGAKTIVNVNGAGNLYAFMANGTTLKSQAARIKVLIDGKVAFYAGFTDSFVSANSSVSKYTNVEVKLTNNLDYQQNDWNDNNLMDGSFISTDISSTSSSSTSAYLRKYLLAPLHFSSSLTITIEGGCTKCSAVYSVT